MQQLKYLFTVASNTYIMHLLFVINPVSGNHSLNFQSIIQQYFAASTHTVSFFNLPANCCADDIKKVITHAPPDRVVAVGGDGTIKLVAEAVIHTNIPLAIVPGGSANGMAKELGIPEKPEDALDIVVNGQGKKIHLIEVNKHLCIHLSDIGFNAFLVKTFETYNSRGMWTYVKAGLKVLFKNPMLEIDVESKGKTQTYSAGMVVIANATKYGTGALINPDGKLDDGFFEVILLKKISFKEIFKMLVTHKPYDTSKTEVLQTAALKITSKRKAHFQVDGEYLGKVNHVTARILKDALEVIVPR